MSDNANNAAASGVRAGASAEQLVERLSATARDLATEIGALRLEQRVSEAMLDALPPDRRYCPICESVCERFEPFGIYPRPDACCPNCRTVERHRLSWLYLMEATNIDTARLRFLHFAPEPGFRDRLRCRKNIAYLSVDLEPGKADQVADIQHLPFADGSFDAIYCSHVLEHIPDDRKAMRELFRVLAPGGWALVMVPLDPKLDATYQDPRIVTPEERLAHYGSPEHVRMYALDVHERLASAGFAVKTIADYASKMSPRVRRICSVREDWMFFCRKESV